MKPGAPMVLVSHPLCPYVQRVAIALREKGLAFERRDIDLARKPDWFLRVSPLGKTPVLLVNGEALFESAVICEYLEDTAPPRLHPRHALVRARHRAWIEFASAMLSLLAAFYDAPDEAAMQARASEIVTRWRRVETSLGDGPYFDGASFSLVDAAFAPVFRYFDVFDTIVDLDFWRDVPRVRRWRSLLAARPSVSAAAPPDYADRLLRFLSRRTSALGRRVNALLPPPAVDGAAGTA